MILGLVGLSCIHLMPGYWVVSSYGRRKI